MLNFTRRYPKLLDSLLKQMLELAHEFEKKLIEMENQNSSKSAPQRDVDPVQNQNANPSQQGSEEQDDTMESVNQNGSGEAETASDSQELSEEQIEAMKVEMEKIADEIVKEFEEEMGQVMDSLAKARDAFQDLEDLLDEKKGFDLNSGLWKRTGWHEMDKLRKKLENLRELRELVRSLGRSGGQGPKRKAPAQVYKAGCPEGVIRSSLQPEETSGLCRTGDLSRMLPPEMALMAAGWSKTRNSNVSKAARLLHLARRAERNLMSYERSGWLDDEPAKVLPRLEYRPAEEQGPIIVCLDTSASMQGVRETVAKAVVLECLRGAHRQQRSCYLYAFSSYSDIKEIELSIDPRSLPTLLDFLEYSFNGGTDVTRALELSVERVRTKEWAQSDILIVTDGEMALPNKEIVLELERAKEDLGMQVHGLLVGNSQSDSMTQLCSELHVFKSWDTAASRN